MISHRYGRPGRLGGIAVALSAAFLLLATEANAAPKPSAADTVKTLESLSRQADKLVDKYDKLKVELAAAKKRLSAIQDDVAEEQKRQQALRVRVAQVAAAAYKNGTLDSSAVIAAKDPTMALEQMSAFTKLSSSRSLELSAYLGSAQRLHREQAQVQQMLSTISARETTLKQQKAAVEKTIAKQKALLPKTVTGHPTGGTYNGSASGSARKAVQYAYAQLGKPYIFGGTGPKGYDCSGLTMMSWRAAGVNIPRVVPDQYNATRHVAKADLQPGDLVYFDDLGHEGIYVGGGQFIHAPHTGTVVKLDTMSNPYWVSHYVGGSRP